MGSRQMQFVCNLPQLGKLGKRFFRRAFPPPRLIGLKQ
jgi:hypothetical protein